MKKNLYIFNYQREIPPFMQMQIRIAKDFFDEIYYITRQLTNDNSDTVDFENVKIIQIPKSIRLKNYILSPISAIFKKYFIRQLFSGKFNLGKLKYLFTHQFSSDNLFQIGYKLLKENTQNHNFLLSTWFSTEALTIARLKRMLPLSFATSFAHSFEIDSAKNDFVPESFNVYKHNYIDEVHYIANGMKELYYETCKNIDSQTLHDEKSKITYLGSIKEFKGFNTISENEKFKIVSCSNISPVKRLNLIIEALKLWDKGKIKWTHIGGGPMEAEIRQSAFELQKINPFIEINFVGQMNNKDVQKYYIENSVDLFINVSEAEGVPVSIMEAFSYGIPALATDVGGTKELVVNNETGLLISKNSCPAEICVAIENYYSLSFERKNEIRTKAFKYWNKVFDAKKNIKRFYKEMVNKHLF